MKIFKLKIRNKINFKVTYLEGRLDLIHARVKIVKSVNKSKLVNKNVVCE